MRGLKLVRVSEQYKSKIEEYLSAFEGKRDRVTCHEERIPGLDQLEEFGSVTEWLKYCESMAGKVTWFLTVRLSDGKVIGSAVLRSALEYDDDDIEFCSHIGYSVRPDERNRGYGSCQFALVLEKAREIGLECVRIVCLDTNIGSNKVIRANGGVYLDTITGEESGLRINRYDIGLV